MPKKDFDDLKSLFAYIEKQVTEIMQDDVAEMVRDVQQEKIDKEVYDAYTTPTYIARRKNNGGLRDRRNMIATVSKNGDDIVLDVKNITQGNPDVIDTDPTVAPNYLAGIIEYGREPERRGRFTYNREGTEGDFLRARPFTAETIKKISRDGLHIKRMKSGLRKRGIDVE